MKKIILFLSVLIICMNVKAQITLSHKNGDWCGVWLDKFHVSGYKYVEWRCSPVTHTINIYNVNNTLLKSIFVPTVSLGGPSYLQEIAYVSEQLFDTDSGMEFAARIQYTTGVQAVYIFDETGPTLFSRDTADFDPLLSVSGGYSKNNIFNNGEMIFFDGVSTKMRLRIIGTGRYETYNLPGTIPCAGCTAGIVSGFTSNGGNVSQQEDARFFPNPAANELKLKYKLPEGSHYAEMKIYDMQGKLVDEFKITDTFDFIYLPTNYNNGLYLYSLIVDGKIVKTEKIVLNK